jgi:tetratricopeptide (TPR) repeat protein
MRYHPPRQSWISEGDFDIYHNVVSMAYQLHDKMLGDLLEKAGDGVTVILVSDHGFHPDHLRPSSIPDIPAGPAIEHRDFGVFAMGGPGIKRDDTLHGPSLLDVAPTILTLYGLPVGDDMDGKVLSQAFVKRPEVAFIPSWEEVSGADGRHPPHTRLDPMAAQAALEQMIALGYIQRPDEDRDIAMRKTLNELRYNLGEAYQDAGRHMEAHEIFTELCKADPDEQRFAVKLFVSCQALGLHREMKRIVNDLDVHRRPRCQPAVIDYLKAQVWIVEKRYAEALAALERVAEAHMLRPGLLLQTADLYLRLRRTRDAQNVYEKALAIDPDNAQAYVGLCRMALRRREFRMAAHSALDALQRTYQDPLAHFLLGRALTGMKDYQRAAEAFRAAISFNPNFPQAHIRLAGLLETHLGDIETAREHRGLAYRMRRGRPLTPALPSVSERNIALSLPLPGGPVTARNTEMPPLSECLIVVTGLPRSGTSMLMQMLAAGNVSVLSDELRAADEDNPRGYLEFEPVKNLLKDSRWLMDARGRAIKIVAPLLAALPPGLACRVIL